MNPISTLKRGLYRLTVGLGDLFRYPRAIRTDDTYDEYWHERRPGDMGSISDWQRERAQIVLEHMSSAGTFADIGCGAGEFLAYLKSKVSLRTIGYDISSRALDAAKANGVNEVIALDIRSPEARTKIALADYLGLFEVLEHVPDSEALLAVAYAKAGKGVFFSVPNTGFLTHRFRLFLGRFPLQWSVHPGEHLRFWTVRDLHWWLGKLGYKNFKIIPYRGIPILNRLLPNLCAAGIVVFIPV